MCSVTATRGKIHFVARAICHRLYEYLFLCVRRDGGLWNTLTSAHLEIEAL